MTLPKGLNIALAVIVSWFAMGTWIHIQSDKIKVLEHDRELAVLEAKAFQKKWEGQIDEAKQTAQQHQSIADDLRDRIAGLLRQSASASPAAAIATGDGQLPAAQGVGQGQAELSGAAVAGLAGNCVGSGGVCGADIEPTTAALLGGQAIDNNPDTNTNGIGELQRDIRQICAASAYAADTYKIRVDELEAAWPK